MNIKFSTLIVNLTGRHNVTEANNQQQIRKMEAIITSKTSSSTFRTMVILVTTFFILGSGK